MGDQISIRAAMPEDADAVFAIANLPNVRRGTLQMPYQSPAVWRERMATTREGSYRVVAEVDGRVLGLASVDVVDIPRRRQVGQIGMMVHDDHQGKGIGRALLEGLLDLADNWLDLHRIELQVYTDNAPAVHLYESSGFVIEGTHRQFAFRDGEYVDAYFMARLKP